MEDLVIDRFVYDGEPAYVDVEGVTYDTYDDALLLTMYQLELEAWRRRRYGDSV